MPLRTAFLIAALLGTGGLAVARDARTDILVVGHRGNAVRAPENTLVSYREARALGADLGECDVRPTSDGTLVLLHDATLDRTTDGAGPISERTLEQVRALEAGSWKAPEYAGEPIPTLAELLAEQSDGAMPIVVEVKAGGAEAALADIRAAEAIERCVMFAFDRPTIVQAAALEPGLPCFWLLSALPTDATDLRALVEGAVREGLSGLSVAWSALTPESVRLAHSRGLSVWTWTANRPEQWGHLAEIGVDAIITDDPGGLRSWLAGGDQVTPAPLYRDPVWDGAADPIVIWNSARKTWWMLYTQRRARAEEPGVAWCHETEVGVAESRDRGLSWSYVGTLALEPPERPSAFWAPDVVRDEAGLYHIFVTCVPGSAESHRDWGGERLILHYTSPDLAAWSYIGPLPLTSRHCIDATLCRTPAGRWRLWYKDEARNSDTLAIESDDLLSWTPVSDPGVSKLYGEGPKVFSWGGSYWMIKDPDSGLDVYRSEDLESWAYQGKILDQPGRRLDDGTVGKHCDVVVAGERAFVIYFTHPYGQDFEEREGLMRLPAKVSAVQAAELELVEGRLICDRDKPFRLLLPAGE